MVLYKLDVFAAEYQPPYPSLSTKHAVMVTNYYLLYNMRYLLCRNVVLIVKTDKMVD